MVTLAKGNETRLNFRVNPQRRSLKGILLLFVEPYIAGARHSEAYLNPELTKVSVTVNGSPNRLYNNGLEGIDVWEEVKRFFLKAKNKTQHMNATKFYTEDKFGLMIDLRSMADDSMHGSGTRLVNTKDGVHLELERNASGSDNVNCHSYVIRDAQMNVIGRQLHCVQYYYNGSEQHPVQCSYCGPDEFRQIKVCGGPDLRPFPRQVRLHRAHLPDIRAQQDLPPNW